MKIAFMGDVMLGRLVNEMLLKSDPAYPWGDTRTILDAADLRICNLECVISDVGNPWSMTPKMFHFRTDEKNVASLQTAQIDIVSIANNHVLDYEDEALLRMIKILDEEKILHAGSGENWEKATQPVVYQVKGKSIGFIAFTDNEPGWKATEDMPGTFYSPVKKSAKEAKFLFEIIQDVRKEVDFLIVSAHWGPNWGYDPPSEQIPFAHKMIDAGADLIFGHSGHVFRGVEIYKDRAIIYSAGDFIDDYYVDEVEKNDETFIFVLDLEQDMSKLYFYPVCISEFQANLADSFRRDAILAKMKALCQGLRTPCKVFPTHALIEF